MGTESLDQNILNTLTPEEQAAIAGDDSADAEALKAIAEGAADGPEDDDDSDSEGGDEATGASEGDPAQAAANAGAGSDTAAAAESGAAAAGAEGASAGASSAAGSPAASDDEADPEISPVFVYKLPEDFKDRVKAVDDAEEAAEAKFEAGELTNAEYRQEIRRIGKERTALDGMQTKADIAAEAVAQAEEAVLRSAFNAAAAEGAKVGIDYKKDTAAFKQLDAFVKVLAADNANAGRSARSLLLEAHRAVAAMRGLKAAPTPAASPGAKPDPAKAKADAAAARKPDLSLVPKTLAQVPGGDGPGDVGGEFDDVLGLEGQAYEDAIESMARTAPQRFERFQRHQSHR